MVSRQHWKHSVMARNSLQTVWDYIFQKSTSYSHLVTNDIFIFKKKITVTYSFSWQTEGLKPTFTHILASSRARDSQGKTTLCICVSGLCIFFSLISNQKKINPKGPLKKAATSSQIFVFTDREFHSVYYKDSKIFF